MQPNFVTVKREVQAADKLKRTDGGGSVGTDVNSRGLCMEGRDAGGGGAGAPGPGSHLQQQQGGQGGQQGQAAGNFNNLYQSPGGARTMASPQAGGVGLVLAPAAVRAAISLSTPSTLMETPPPASAPHSMPGLGMSVAPPSTNLSTLGIATGGLSAMGLATPQASNPVAVLAPRGSVEPQKRKRGRPRKYGAADGASPVIHSQALVLSNNSSSPAATTPVSPSEKRGRGRPPGSGKKQQLAALGSSGQGFTPHVLTIAAGEDVANKIHAFAQLGTRAVCVMSANGAISNVTLRQPATSGGTVTYEGRFEILSLSGSLLSSESGGTRRREGGLSVSLAGPDGRVVGGGVGGMLTAASPVQVVVGSFVSDGGKSPPMTGNGDTPGLVALSVRTPKSESTGTKGASSPLSQSIGGSGSSQQPHHQVISQLPQPLSWPGSSTMETRRNTDMNEPPHDR